jgi:hypothetical protein
LFLCAFLPKKGEHCAKVSASLPCRKGAFYVPGRDFAPRERQKIRHNNAKQAKTRAIPAGVPADKPQRINISHSSYINGFRQHFLYSVTDKTDAGK